MIKVELESFAAGAVFGDQIARRSTRNPDRRS